jgi:DinB family protein
LSDSGLPNDLKALISQFEKSKQEIDELLNGLTEEQFNKKPGSGGWSVGECVDHLIITGKDYTNQIERGLKKAQHKNLILKSNYKFSWLGKSFIKNIEPPVKRKFKVPARWTPDSKLNLKNLKSEYLNLQDRYIDLIYDSNGLDIMKVKLPSPATSLLRFSIYEMFAVNAAHQRRHLWQAGNTKKEIF